MDFYSRENSHDSFEQIILYNKKKVQIITKIRRYLVVFGTNIVNLHESLINAWQKTNDKLKNRCSELEYFYLYKKSYNISS